MSDLAQLLSGLGGLARLAPEGAVLVGIGWATVDLDRSLEELAQAATRAGDRAFGPTVEDGVLGARGRVAWLGVTALVVLEPATEGRLAAALARRGEGVACLYLASGPSLTGSTRGTALGRPGRVLPHDRPWGPFLVLVDPLAAPSDGRDQGSRSP